MFNENIATESVLLDSGTNSENRAVDLSLTESGEITGDVIGGMVLSETPEDPSENLTNSQKPSFYKFCGKNNNDTKVKLKKSKILKRNVNNKSVRVTEISPSVVVFNSAPDDPIVDKDVTIEFDMLNFRAPNTWFPQPDDTPLLKRNEFSIQSHQIDRFKERIQKIKEYKRSLRTATVTLTHSINGPVDIQFDNALRTLQPAMWLIAFVQGVFPAPVRARITTVDGDTVPWTYERWMTTWRSDIGHAFSGGRIDHANDMRVFLDHGYDRFVERVEQYRYRRCISWYLDAMLRDRTLNAQIASISAGIEVLAERYEAHSDTTSGNTADRIQNLVNSLDVDVKDLAEFSEEFDETSGGTEEYFYANSRNFVLHNAQDDMPFDNIFRDYEAVITLFRRILVNEFVLDEERDRYTSLLDLSPTDQRFK